MSEMIHFSLQSRSTLSFPFFFSKHRLEVAERILGSIYIYISFNSFTIWLVSWGVSSPGWSILLFFFRPNLCKVTNFCGTGLIEKEGGGGELSIENGVSYAGDILHLKSS